MTPVRAVRATHRELEQSRKLVMSKRRSVLTSEIVYYSPQTPIITHTGTNFAIIPTSSLLYSLPVNPRRHFLLNPNLAPAYTLHPSTFGDSPGLLSSRPLLRPIASVPALPSPPAPPNPPVKPPPHSSLLLRCGKFIDSTPLPNMIINGHHIIGLIVVVLVLVVGDVNQQVHIEIFLERSGVMLICEGEVEHRRG